MTYYLLSLRLIFTHLLNYYLYYYYYCCDYFLWFSLLAYFSTDHCRLGQIPKRSTKEEPRGMAGVVFKG